MFSNLSRREKILLSILLITVLLTLYNIYIYQPTIEQISELETIKNQKENRLNVAINFARKVPFLKKEHKHLMADIKARGKYPDKNKIDLLIDFREAVKERELDLKIFSPVREEEKYIIRMNIDGDFDKLCYLLEDFGSWNYWFEFKEIRIEKSNQGVLAALNVNYHDQIYKGGELNEE